MPLFEKKEKISRSEFRRALSRKNPIVPGTYKRLFGFKEKKEMEKRLFGKKKFGGETSKEKFKRLIREMGTKKYKASDPVERRIISRRIRYLKRLSGIKK